MRVWLDPNKLNSYSLTPDDVTTAITSQNTQISVGQLGAAPAVNRPAIQRHNHRAKPSDQHG